MAPGKASQEQKLEFWIPFFACAYLLTLGLNLVLLFFVVLKEDPLFWRNEGGYPVFLRDLVLQAFYPLFLFQFIALSVLSICQLRVVPTEKVFRITLFVAIG